MAKCVFLVQEHTHTHTLKLQGRSLAWGLQLSEQQASVSWGIGDSEQPNSYWGRVCVCLTELLQLYM